MDLTPGKVFVNDHTVQVCFQPLSPCTCTVCSIGTVFVSPFLTRDSFSCPFFSCAGAAVSQPPCFWSSHDGMGGWETWLIPSVGDCWALPTMGPLYIFYRDSECCKVQQMIMKSFKCWLNLLGSVLANRVSSFCHEDVLWELLWVSHSFSSSCYVTHDHEEFWVSFRDCGKSEPLMEGQAFTAGEGVAIAGS